MKFEELYSVLMEIPHGHVNNINTYDTAHKLRSITYIDYCLEKWEIPFEVKSSMFNILSTLNDNEIILLVRISSVGPKIHLINKAISPEEIDLENSDKVLELIDSNNIEKEEFVTYVYLNHEHFIYYNEDFDEVIVS